MATSAALPLQVQAAVSQVVFSNGGPVLNLGLTLQIPVNDLIEALLAYQSHFERTPVPTASKTESEAAPVATQEKASVPRAPQPVREEHSALVGHPTWDTDFSTLHKTKGEDYAKKSKWALEKGFVPTANKKVEPLLLKNFQVVTAGSTGSETRPDERETRSGTSADPPNLTHQVPSNPSGPATSLPQVQSKTAESYSSSNKDQEFAANPPPGLSPPRRISENDSAQAGLVPVLRRSVASTPGPDGEQEKDCKQQ